MSAHFGPGGNSEAFKLSGFKSTIDAPRWLKSIGLNAYEYEAGNGLAATPATLMAIGREAQNNGIKMSYHTPYFISLSGVVEEKRLKSIEYIRQSLDASKLLGATTIVVHAGSAAKISRDEAMRLAGDTLARTVASVDTYGIKIGIETMGKVNQLGTLDEVLTLCKLSDRFAPVVDFGHLNARTLGSIKADDDYEGIFNQISSRLGREYADNLHCHFSKIEYTGMGEKKHLTFEDTLYGPSPESLAQVIARLGYSPTVICESAGTQSADAKYLKNQYEQAKNN